MGERESSNIAGREIRASSSFLSRLSHFKDEDEVLLNLTRMLKRQVKCRWVVLYLMERENQSFAPARSCGLPKEWEPLFHSLPLLPSKQGVIRHIIAKRRHLVIADPGHSELLSPFFQKKLHTLTLLAVPLQVRQQVLGVIFIARSRRYQSFTRQDIAAVRDLVAQAALVTSHIRLFDESLDMAVEMAKRVDIILMLDDINKAISSSLSHDRIVATAIERIEGVVGCDFQAVIGKRNSELVMLASRSQRLELSAGILGSFAPEDLGVIGRSLTTGEIEYVQDLKQVAELTPFEKGLLEAGMESLLAVPLSMRTGINGLLLLADHLPGRFRREDAFAIEKIASQLAVALENARLYEEMRQLFFNTVASLANAIDAKSPWTKGHSDRVMRIAAGIARNMHMSDEEVERVRLGGLLHDIGKIGIIEALLDKPIELDEDEFPPIRLHPEKGVAILEPIEQLKNVLPAILYHHEWFNGSGYPKGLAGEAIPLHARIIAVADSFDAMVADRPYRTGLSVAEAVQELVRCSGTQFDPDIVDCFRLKLAEMMKDQNLAPPSGRGCR